MPPITPDTNIVSGLVFGGHVIKKPLKPAGLFAAVFLVLLNILLLSPDLINQNLTLVNFFINLGGVWQALIVSILILLISYILISLEGFILRFAAGESWANSIVFVKLLIRFQKRRLDSYILEKRKWKILRKKIKELKIGFIQKLINIEEKDGNNSTINKQLEEAKIKKEYHIQNQKLIQKLVNSWQRNWEGSSLFPAEEGYLKPTALGNVIGATQSFLWQRYRIELSSMLPILESTLGDENKLIMRVQSEKATLLFLLNLAFVSIFFIVEFLILNFIWSKFTNSLLLISILMLLAVYFLFYRTAVQKAKSWGQAVQAAFIAHRKELKLKLGLKADTSLAEERVTFRKFSNWIYWGPNPKESFTKYPFINDPAENKWEIDKLFDTPSPQVLPAVHFSDNANVIVKRSLITIQPNHVTDDNYKTIVAQYV